MRAFGTGATRDDDANKPDPEGFFSPRVLAAYGDYMHRHRKQADGTMRGSDNWQAGMPIEAYQKSLIRHTHQAWGVWRGESVLDDRGDPVDLLEALCAVLFNTQGLIFELTRDSRDSSPTSSSGTPSP